MKENLVKVLKFGGSSVGSAEALGRLVEIVRREQASGRPVLVVSALSGVTDHLLALAEEFKPKKRQSHLRKVVRRHQELSREILKPEVHARYLNMLTQTIDWLMALCRMRDGDVRRHGIWAAGELMSAPLIALLLEQEGVHARSVDARKMVRVVRSGSGAWVVDRNMTRSQIEAWFKHQSSDTVPIVTGFIGSDATGQTVTLGRGGSDYSASLIAEAIQAKKFDRWTDVDGLYNADPNKVEGANRFMYMLLEDATTWNEGSQLGMHAHAFEPVLQACIPVHVRSTRNPQGDGTLIMPSSLANRVEQEARALMDESGSIPS